MIDNQKIADLADQAANEIDVRGHAKHVLTDGKGRVCARGAVFVALLGRPVDGLDLMLRPHIEGIEIAVSNAVERHLGLTVSTGQGVGAHHLAQWNNAPERTAEEVTSALRETAASLRLIEVAPTVPAPRTTPENVGV